jgi:2',3'-cyclic-nucleotide 2'-phosphodiesterase/3'-nucleotidase
MNMLYKVISEAKAVGIHVLSANIYKSDNSNFVLPYYIKTVNTKAGAVKVGILGLTTKMIPELEPAENYKGLHFNDLVSEAGKWVKILKTEGADIIVVVVHSGEKASADTTEENQVKELAVGVNGINAIVAGHTHKNIPSKIFTNIEGKPVLVTQPGSLCKYVSKLRFGLRKSNGQWSIVNSTADTVAMDEKIPTDGYITNTLLKQNQDTVLKYLNTVIGKSTDKFDSTDQCIKETASMDLVNKIQKQTAGTQLSISAPLNPSAKIPSGNITIRDIYSVYIYEGSLYSIRMTGKQIKNWLEYSARYYKKVLKTEEPTVKDTTLDIPDYNLDQLYGAEYIIDLTQSVGNRIKNLKYKGHLIKDTDVFTVAINSYRYNGGGGFMAAAGLTAGRGAIYDSSQKLGENGTVRNIIIDYIKKNKIITPKVEKYWRVSK